MTRRDLAILLLPAALFALAFVALRADGALADDWELFCLLRPTEYDRVAWPAVFEDLWTPWLASDVRNYYRPLSTLVFGAWLGVFGFDPALASFAPGALHALATALLALLLRRLLPTAPAGALAVVAAFFAVHPAMPEVANWFTALMEPLQTVCTLVACHALVSARRGGGARWMLAAGSASLGAMCSKESGLVAPVALFVLDLHLAPRPRLRLDRLAVAGVPLAIYLGLRVAFTALTPTANAAPLDAVAWSPAGAALALVDKLSLVAAPVFENAGAARPWLGLAVVVLLVAATARRAIALGALAVTLACLGTTIVAKATPTYVGARVLYAASAAFAVAVAAAACRPVGRTRAVRIAVAATATLWLATQIGVAAVRSTERFADFRVAVRAGNRYVASLREHAATRPPVEPLALLSAPWEPRGVLTLLPSMAFPTLARTVEGPTPLLAPHFGPPPGFYVPLSLRALTDLPTTFVDDAPGDSRGARFTPAASLRPPGAPAPTLAPVGDGRFAFAGGPVSPLTCEAVDVVCAAPAVSIRVAPVLGVPLPDDLDTGMTVDLPAAASAATIPVADSVPFVTARLLGGLVGVEVTATGPDGAPVAIRSAAARATLVALEATVPDLTEVTPASIATTLRTPATTTPDGELWATILSGGSPLVFRVTPDAPLELPPDAAAELRRILRVVPTQLAVVYFHERAPAAGGHADADGTLRARSVARRLVLRR